MKYRKKPVEIDAIVWTGTNFDDLFKFTDADNNYGIVGVKDGRSEVLQIRTLEGVMDAQPGDYIIKGVKGEFYPCKPDIFDLTYDLVIPEPTSGSTKDLSFGQQLVGLTFNPSGDPKVQRVKELCAELANLLNDAKNEKTDNGNMMTSQLYGHLFNHTVGEILNAQMNVVKVLTLKY